MASLSPEAAAFAASRECCFAAAVIVPGEGLTFEFQGETTFPLLSIAKVPIMLTVLHQTIAEHRQLTFYEAGLIDQMIRTSDNDAASALWETTGAEAVQAFLKSAGLAPIQADPYAWGDMLASPLYVATLLEKLLQGEILDEPGRAIAMEMLGTVADSQDWGATVGVRAATTGVKNGWYRDGEGAMIHSAAYVVPEGAPAYTIAVFTRDNVSPLAGIKAIEEFATHVNAAMAARAGDRTPPSGSTDFDLDLTLQ
jgi:hypothetical protein